MSVIIGYKGKLDDPSRLNEALQEIRTFSKEAGWPHEAVTEQYSGVILISQAEADGDAKPKPDPEPWPELPQGHTGLRARVSKLHPPPFIEETCRGILVDPPGADSVRLVFNPKGRLCHYRDLPASLIYNRLPDTVHYVAFPSFVNTTGAVESHIGICLLLHTLKQKYMSKLRVDDPTGFFRTWNLDKLRKEHAVMETLVGLLSRSTLLPSLLKAAGAAGMGEKMTILRQEEIPVRPRGKTPLKRSSVN